MLTALSFPAKCGRAFFSMIQKKIEFPEKPQPEHIVLLIELTAAFHKIPQRYCILCKAKTSLGIEGHRTGKVKSSPKLPPP